MRCVDALGGGGHRRDRDAGGIAQHRFREVRDVLRHGGREEQRLPLDRQLADDFADVVDEAHVEHAVGFVEHQELDRAEPQRVALDHIEQAAGGGDHDFDALHDRTDLAAHRHAADGERRGQADVAAIGIEAVEDLAGQFAGRREHQHAAGLWLRPHAMLEQAVQDRQREGCGLAGAGLGDADDVTSGESEGDGLGLDGRGRQIIFFLERTRDWIGKAEILKGGQKVVLSIKTAGARLQCQERAEGVRDNPRVWGVGCVG